MYTYMNWIENKEHDAVSREMPSKHLIITEQNAENDKTKEKFISY